MSTLAETILITVDVAANQARLVELTKQLNENRDAQKALAAANTAGRITSDELAAGQVRLKQTAAELTGEQRVLLKANNDQVAANKAGAGSIEQLRAQLALSTKAYNGLSQSERDNTEAGQKLQATNKGLSDQLKVLEKAVGDTRRNVGNYQEGVTAALRETNLFGVNVGQTADSLKGNLQAGLNAAKLGFTGLKAAIAATGVGLLVIAFTSLVEYFRRTDEGQEKLAGALAGFGAGVQVITGYVVDFGKFLFDAFTHPIEAIKNIGKFLVDIVANPRAAFTSFVSTLNTGFASVKSKIVAAYDAGVQLSEQGNRLEDAEIRAIARNAEAEKQIGRLTLSARDKSVAEEKRLANLARADELEKQVLNRNLDVERLRLSILAKKNEQADKNNQLQDADRRKQQEQLARISQLEGAAAEANQTRQNRRATLLAEIAADKAAEATAAAEKARKQAEAAKKEADAAAARVAALATEAKREYTEALQLLENYLDTKRAVIERDFAAGLIGENEYQKQLNAIEKAGNAAALVNAKDYAKDTGAIEKKQAETEIKEVNRVKNEKKRIAGVENDIQQAALQAAAVTTDAIISALGEETAAGQAALAVKKTLALAEIAINLQRQLSLNATYAATLGPLGPPYLVATNALAIAGALAGAAKVAGFARGGYVSGAGTGTSDSIPARLSNGESVMNANTTAMFTPLLSHLNTLGGGVAFASGGLVPGSPARATPLNDGGLLARQLGGAAPQMDYPTLIKAIADYGNFEITGRQIEKTAARRAFPRAASTLG